MVYQLNSSRFSLTKTYSEHLTFDFCPEVLVNYRSTDVPDFMRYSEITNRAKIEELRIEQGDLSKRHDEIFLRKCWSMKSPEQSLDLQPWFKEDKVLRKIINMGEASDAALLANQNGQGPSSLHSRDKADTVNEAPMVNTTLDTMPDLSNKLPPQSHDSHEATVEIQDISLRPTVHPNSKRQSSPCLQSPKAKRTTRPTRDRKLPACKGKASKNTKVSKNPLPPALRTRSRKITKLYQLDPKGSAISYRQF